jgi:hypothetical protein
LRGMGKVTGGKKAWEMRDQIIKEQNFHKFSYKDSIGLY